MEPSNCLQKLNLIIHVFHSHFLSVCKSCLVKYMETADVCPTCDKKIVQEGKDLDLRYVVGRT